jgi:hypothetical protein
MLRTLSLFVNLVSSLMGRYDCRCNCGNRTAFIQSALCADTTRTGTVAGANEISPKASARLSLRQLVARPELEQRSVQLNRLIGQLGRTGHLRLRGGRRHEPSRRRVAGIENKEGDANLLRRGGNAHKRRDQARAYTVHGSARRSFRGCGGEKSWISVSGQTSLRRVARANSSNVRSGGQHGKGNDGPSLGRRRLRLALHLATALARHREPFLSAATARNAEWS